MAVAPVDDVDRTAVVGNECVARRDVGAAVIEQGLPVGAARGDDAASGGPGKRAAEKRDHPPHAAIEVPDVVWLADRHA